MKSLHDRFAFTILAVASNFVVGLLATPAASQPSASRSEVPLGITLVGARGGIPDPAGEFQIVVRDAASNPIPFTTVRIDFSQCLDVWPSSVQPYAGVNMDCATRIVSTTTDA